MDDLIIRAFQGRATPDESRRIEHWRSLDKDNEERYRALQRLWVITSFAEPVAEDVPSPNPEELIGRAERRDAPPGGDAPGATRADAGRERSRRAKGRMLRGTMAGLRTGLVAAGVAALGFGLAVLAEGVGLLPEPLAARTVTTGPGEVVTVSLADGSNVRVGPESELTFLGTGRNRTVRLDGRAFFGIAEDDTRRFIVRTEQGEVAVFGTRFEVRSQPEQFRVMVVEGKVGVSSREREIELLQGEMSRTAPGRALSKMRVSDVYAQLDWMGNHLVFRATPLAQAVEEVRRQFGVTVALEAPELEDVPVTATFTNSSAEDVIHVLCKIVEAECKRDLSTGHFRIEPPEATG